LLPIVLAVTLLAPAGAHAGSSEDFLAVFKAYQAAGVVNGCKFSATKLASAKKGVPPDIDTYAPDFPASLDAALRKRASGDCDKAAAAASKGSENSSSPSAAGGSAAGGSTPAGAPAAGAPGAGAPVAGTPGAGVSAGAPAAATSTTPAPAPDAVAAPAAADGSVASAATRNASARTADDAPLPLVLLAVLAALALLAGLLWALARYLAFDPPWLAASRHAMSEAGWRASAWWAEFTDWVRLGR